jgi:acyl-coenzyme A synthetase/AMP-(fatty) acid ligase
MVSSLDSSFFTDYPEYTLLPGVHVQIRDESGRVLGPDSHGYIHIQGPTCTPRVRDSQQTVIGDDYFLKTGDFGSLSADRKLQIRGRFDGVVKINGRHVLLQEIETQALSYFPEWITAQVLLKHVGERLQLFVVYEAPDWAQAKDETIKHFRRELRLKLGLPVHTLRVEQMPRAQNGKIQRNRLEQDVDQALKLQYGLG